MQSVKRTLWWIAVLILLLFAAGALTQFLYGMYHLAFGPQG